MWANSKSKKWNSHKNKCSKYPNYSTNWGSAWAPAPWAVVAALSSSLEAVAVSSYHVCPPFASTDQTGADCPTLACAARCPHAPCCAPHSIGVPRWPCRCGRRRTPVWRATAPPPCHRTCAEWCQKCRRHGSSGRAGRDSFPGNECVCPRAGRPTDRHRRHLVELQCQDSDTVAMGTIGFIDSPGIRGIARDVFSISPARIFSVANIYFNSSPTATSATFAVRHPSWSSSTTISSCGAPSLGPSRTHLIQRYCCLMPPPMPLATMRPLTGSRPAKWVIFRGATVYSSGKWTIRRNCCPAPGLGFSTTFVLVRNCWSTANAPRCCGCSVNVHVLSRRVRLCIFTENSF